jgi:ABC-type transport system involved in multi-copper enzyme maturation permease subunit
MSGLGAIYRKELSDNFSSFRFVILFALIAMVSFIISYMAGVSLRENLEGVAKPKFVFLMLFNTKGALFSLVEFVAVFGPLIGLVLGFDSINGERARGTLVKLVSQPIYRDAVINGKFLAGATTIAILIVSIVLVISGFGLTLVGVVPGVEEILRLAIYVVISIFYISFWLGLSILFSIAFRSVATSFLASVALWIFLSFFVSLGASVLANSIARQCAHQRGSVPYFPHVHLLQRHGNDRGPYEKNYPVHGVNGTHGATFLVPLSEPVVSRAESCGGLSSACGADCDQCDLLCRILLDLHDAGDQNVMQASGRKQNPTRREPTKDHGLKN